jgi:hypothetical protein
MVLGFDHPHALSQTEFASVFGDQQPIIFNFHGYNSVIKGLTFERTNVPNRLHVHGYKEEGTTTTPFRMLTANGKFINWQRASDKKGKPRIMRLHHIRIGRLFTLRYCYRCSTKSCTKWWCGYRCPLLDHWIQSPNPRTWEIYPKAWNGPLSFDRATAFLEVPSVN